MRGGRYKNKSKGRGTKSRDRKGDGRALGKGLWVGQKRK